MSQDLKVHLLPPRDPFPSSTKLLSFLLALLSQCSLLFIWIGSEDIIVSPWLSSPNWSLPTFLTGCHEDYWLTILTMNCFTYPWMDYWLIQQLSFFFKKKPPHILAIPPSPPPLFFIPSPTHIPFYIYCYRQSVFDAFMLAFTVPSNAG